MPGETLNQHKKVSRPLGVSLGVTEVIHLLGLLALATGISLAISIPYALIVVGLFLIRTAENNAKERGTN